MEIRGNGYLYWGKGMNTNWNETQRTSGRLGIIYILIWVVITQVYTGGKVNRDTSISVLVPCKHFILSLTKK